jgi:hypothetical protein
MSAPTRLQRLRAGLDAIPQKRRRRSLLDRLKRYHELAGKAEALVRDTAGAEQCSLAVFPDLVTTLPAESRRKAARAAARLAARLRASIEAVQDDASDQDVIALGEAGKAADRALRDRWSRALDERLKGYGALARAAESAKLSRSQIMATQLTVLKTQASSPPLTVETAEKIAAALAGLAGLVSQLGLEGAAGEFLIAAANHQGDARALRDPAVLEFVERHELWPLLVVSLR